MEYTRRRPDEAAEARARARWNRVAKPLGGLGLLEDMIVRIAGIQGTEDVRLTPRCAVVFCGDHGVVAEGVSQSDASVTALVARCVAEGSSNVNLMARCAGAEVFCVDAGMQTPVAHPALIQRAVARGAGNIARMPAMRREQAQEALAVGRDVVRDLRQRGYQMIAVGEMGIGNTTACAALVCALTGLSPEEAVGRGAGLSDAGLERKRAAVRRALAVNRPTARDPLGALAGVGGFEIAAMTGAFLGGMECGVPMVVDGAVSAAAALTATLLCPEAGPFLLASHVGREPACSAILSRLGLQGIIHAELALGEGTGAVALFPLLDMALSVYMGPHTFESLHIPAYVPREELP